MKVSISEAARLSGVSRQTLYVKYINKGVLSVERDNADKPVIDTAELLRVFPGMQIPDSYVSTNGHEFTAELSRKIDALDSELKATLEQLRASQEREKWLQGTVDKLTDTIKLLEHKEPDQPAPKRGFWARIFGG